MVNRVCVGLVPNVERLATDFFEALLFDIDDIVCFYRLRNDSSGVSGFGNSKVLRHLLNRSPEIHPQPLL